VLSNKVLADCELVYVITERAGIVLVKSAEIPEAKRAPGNSQARINPWESHVHARLHQVDVIRLILIDLQAKTYIRHTIIVQPVTAAVLHWRSIACEVAHQVKFFFLCIVIITQVLEEIFVHVGIDGNGYVCRSASRCHTNLLLEIRHEDLILLQ